MITRAQYIESVENLLNQIRKNGYEFIVEAPREDITSVKGSRRIAEQAELIFASVNYITDTCFLLKNRHGVYGTVGLTMLCFLINEAIERMNGIDRSLEVDTICL